MKDWKWMLHTILTLCCIKTFANESLSISYKTLEERGINVKIGNIMEDSNLTHKMDQNFRSSLIFNLMPKGYEHTKYFKINPVTSEIRTNRNINREEVCDSGSKKCILSILVGVRSKIKSSHLDLVSIEVQVIDTNDHAPKFTPSYHTINIPESVSPGSKYRIPSAFDQDLDKFGVQRYKLDKSVADFFYIEQRKTVDKSDLVYVTVNKTLDRENTPVYKFWVYAEDGGTPAKIGVLRVTVNVIDANDHPPKFSKNSYTAKFREDFPKDSVLLKVHATDRDQGINGRVYYVMAKQTKLDIKRQFSLNETSGEIVLRSQLDYERHQTYTFMVEAVDGGSQAHVSQALVIIEVEDVNDERPVIHLNLLSPIPENAKLDHFIVLLTVTDLDSGDNGRVTCDINTHLFKLVGSNHQYKLFLNTTLNYERDQKYNVMVTCKDMGLPANTVRENIELTIQDINDNPPIFEKTHYTSSVVENCDIGTTVQPVKAKDADSGNNSVIRYKLSTVALDYFAIDPISGIISTAAEIDRELQPRHKFLVIAQDLGNPPLQSTTEVTVNVNDVNDIQPYFTSDYFPFYFPENDEINGVIGKVTAIDRDLGNNSVLTYSIFEEDSGVPFSVSSRDGIIHSLMSFDREKVKEYRFRVQAQDKGVPPLSGMTTVTVYISDRNDNKPEITIIRNVTFKLPFSSIAGSVVFQVKAFDRDFSKNGKLQYRIISGNEKGLVKVDRIGRVLTVVNMTEANIGQYSVLIEVSDQGTPPLFARASYNFEVTSRPTERDSNYLLIIIILVASTVCIACIILAVIVCLRRRRHIHVKDTELYNNCISYETDHKSRCIDLLAPNHNKCEIVRNTNLKLPSSHEPHRRSLTPLQTSVFSVDMQLAPQSPSPGFTPGDTVNLNHYQHHRPYSPLYPGPTHFVSDSLQKCRVNEMLQRLDAHSDTSADSGHGPSEEDAISIQQKDNVRLSTRLMKPSRATPIIFEDSPHDPLLYTKDHRHIQWHPPTTNAVCRDTYDNQPVQSNCQLYLNSRHLAEHSKSSPHRTKELPSISNYLELSPCNRSYPYRERAGSEGTSFEISSAYTDPDSDTTTSGSYVVNADQLVNEIDRAFFGSCAV